MPKNQAFGAFPWASLPLEIRLMILEEISTQKYRGWALCAAVCKEWQATIEPRNFNQLNLQTSCLDEFESLIIRPRPFVHHVCLNIELPRYACPTCQRDANLSSTRVAGIFRKAITRLFSILSIWQPSGRLILELNASSPSDSEHWFKNYYFGPGHENPGALTEHERAFRWHDPKHGWVHGQQVEPPDVGSVLRLFSPICLTPPQKIPQVHAVTDLWIRRQNRHEILPEVLRALLIKLPRLENVVYELWRVHRYHHCKTASIRDLIALEDTTPMHVKSVSIFKDFNDHLELALNNAMGNPRQCTGISSAALDLALAKAFAGKGQNLERLSISYMIDGQQLFAACQQLSLIWENLQLLALTSKTLSPMAPRKDFDALLRSASSTVLNMPQLKSMVLWNTESQQACAVIYQRNTAKGSSSLTWRGTWDFELSNDVAGPWKNVAPGSRYFHVKKEVLWDVDIKSHGDAIHYLRLPDGVIDPESLWQIRQEGRIQRLA